MAKQDQDITLLRQRLAQSNIIVDATRRFAATLNPKEVQQALFESAFQVMGAQQFALHLAEDDGWQSEVCYPLEGMRLETAVLPPNATAINVFETHEPVFWQQDKNQGAEPPVSIEFAGGFDSYVALPLKGAAKVVGVLEAFGLLEPQNSEQQTELLKEIAGPASLAIYNAQLYQEARVVEKQLAKRATELEIVSQVSVYAATILETEKLLEEVVNLAKDQFDLYHAHIYLLNTAGDTLNLAMGAGEVGQQMVAQGRSIPLTQKQSLVAQAARDGLGLIENDVRQNPAFLPHPLLPKTRSEMALPMIVGSKLVGVLDVQADKVDYFSDEDVAIQTTMAAQIAVAVENARSFEQMQEAVTNLNKITQRLTSEGWQEYLDQRKEALAFSYNPQQTVEVVAETAVSPQEQSFTLPLHIQSEAIGQLQLDLPTDDDLEASEIVTAVAERLSAHLENLRLAERSEQARAAAEKRNQEMAVINRVTTRVSTSLDLQQSLQVIVDELVDSLNVDQARVALIQPENETLVIIAEKFYPNAPSAVGTAIPVKGDKLSQEVIKTRKMIVLEDAQHNPLTAPVHDMLRKQGVETMVLLPLLTQDEVFGTVGLEVKGKKRLDPDALRVAETIVYQAATAVQNARLFNQTQEALAETNKQAKRLALLNEMSEAISRQATMQDIVNTVMEKAPAILDAARISLHLLEAGEETMLRVAGVAGQVGDVAIDDQLPLADSPMAEALITRQLVSGYFETDNERLNAYFAPLFAGEDPIGTFNIAVPAETVIKENDRQILLQMASILGTSFENRQLFDQTQARAERERLINKVVTQVAASLDLQHSLQIIVDEMATALNVDQVRVALIQSNGQDMRVIAEHYNPQSPSAIGMVIPIEGNDLTQEVMATRKMVVVEDAQNSPRTAPVHEMFREQGIQTVILLPLVVSDEVLGTIGLDILDGRSLEADTLQLAETIVFQAAIAIQNARLFEQSQAALAETEKLYNFSAQLNAATSLDAALAVAAEPGMQIGASRAVLIIYDHDQIGQPEYGHIMAITPKNNGGMMQVGTKLYMPDQPLNPLWTARNANTVLVGDVFDDARLQGANLEIFRKNDIRSLVLMFLLAGNLRLGQIAIHWNQPQTFTDADRRLYGAIAQQASSVVYNRLLFNQTEEALSETAALYQANVDLNSADTLDKVLTTLRKHTVLGQGSNDVSLNLFDRVWEHGQVPDMVHVPARWSTLEAEMPNRYKLDTFPEAGTVLKPDELLICADVATDERMGERTRAIFTQRFKAKSLLYVPLVVGGQWIGFINGVYATSKEFPEAQIRRLNVLARQAAVSVRSIQLLDQAHRRANREALINNITQKIQSTPTIQFALQTAVTELSQALKLKSAAIELTNEKPQNGNGRSNNQNGS